MLMLCQLRRSVQRAISRVFVIAKRIEVGLVYPAGLVQDLGEEFPRLTAVVSGELIAFYQVGYGIAAFGTGLLLGATHVQLSAIYVGASLIAGVMIVLAFLVIRPPFTATSQETGSPSAAD